MKKILISIFLFFTFFMIIDKAQAAGDDTNTVYFDLENSRFTSVYDSIKPKLDEVVDYLKNNNPNNHNWAVYFGRDNSGAFVYLNLLPSDFSGTFSSGNYCLSSAAVWNNSYYYMYGGCQTKQVYSKKHTFRINDDISSLKTDMSLPFGSISGMSTGSMYMQLSGLNKFTFTNNQYDYFSNNVNFILSYASTVKLYNYISLDYYRLKIGDNEISTDTNTYLEPSDNYFEVEEPYVAKSSLEFDKQVHNFDIYVDKSDKLADLTYKLNYVDHNDYTNTDMTKAKLYGVMFYGLKNENGLYHWEQLDDCTNWDFPSEYCHVKSKYDQLESELGKDGYTVEGYVDFLSIFDEYDTVRIVIRLDNAFAGKIDYWDKNLKISALDVDINYFGFDYARNLNDSDLNRYVIFTTKEQEITDNMFIVSSSDEIFIDYFDTKEGSFREYTAMDPRKNYDNTYIFTYDKIGLNNNLGFYVLTDKNRTERLVYNFYIKPHLYFSYNNSDVLEDAIYIDNTGNITNNNIAITPDELVDYEYDDINDLFENIKKFNDSINVISNEIHGVIQHAYDSLNIYIKSFLISIFTIILVSATIILIRR